MTSSYLVFLLGGRHFGVKLVGAIEILPWRRARPVPLSYPYIEGLIDYRGVIYPVYDLVRRIGISRQAPIGFTAADDERPETGRSIILLEEQGVPFGITVDTVVKMAPYEDPAGAPQKSPGIEPGFVKGPVFEGDQQILILDSERLLHAG